MRNERDKTQLSQEDRFEKGGRLLEYPAYLRGPSQNRHGGNQMCRLRGFKGAGFRYFGPGRVLEGDEKQRTIEELRARGEID